MDKWTLTKAWEYSGKMKPPFKFVFKHPGDSLYKKEVTIYEIKINSFSTYFRDDEGFFDGDNVEVKSIHKKFKAVLSDEYLEVNYDKRI